MLSRVAENLYWVSRYIERAENIARIIDVNFNLVLDSPIEEENEQWAPLIQSSGDEEEFEKKHGENYSRDNVVSFLSFDEENSNSIWNCVRSARFNAKGLRPIISPEMWEELNYIYHFLSEFKEKGAFTDEELEALFEKIVRFSHQFVGLTNRTLLRDTGWDFLKLGRLLERADKITRILDVKYFIILPNVDYVNTPYDDIQWAALLRSASAFEQYRRKFHQIEYDKVIQFLLLDKTFPRSIRFCIDEAVETIKDIDDGNNCKTYEKVFSLSKELQNISVKEIKNHGLHEYLDLIQVKLNEIGDLIYQDYL